MQLPVTNSKDPISGRLTVNFGSSGTQSIAARHCDFVVLSSGESPSYAVVPMPLANFGPGKWDEIAPAVALQSNGPAGAVKLRTPATVYASIGSTSIPVLKGYAVSYSHQIGEDSIIAEIYDARWILTKYSCFGCLVWDPTINKVWWDLARDLVYNALGYPDCLDHPQLGPVHAPCHRFGYKNDFSDSTYNQVFEDYSEPAPGTATTRARSWRPQDAILNQRNRFVGGAAQPPRPVDIGNTLLPPDIIWPQGLGQFDTARTLKDFAVCRDGVAMSLCQALQALAREAGPYDLYVENNTLQFVDMAPKAGTGTRLITATYASGIGEAANNPCVVKAGNVRESFINGFDESVLLGDPPCLEIMASMDVNNVASAGATGVYPIMLEPAWDDADEAAFKDYIGKFGGLGGVVNPTDPNWGGTSQAFDSACDRWPLVYVAYRIKMSYDLWQNTKWAGMKNGGYPRIKPFQLTGYQQDQSNPRLWIPREIIVEYYDDFNDRYDLTNWTSSPPSPTVGTDNMWKLAARFDNLTLSPDGTVVMLSALRKQSVAVAVGGTTWVVQQKADPTTGAANSHNSNSYWGAQMRKRPLRIQLAAEADWPLVSIKGRGGAASDDPNKIYDRVEATPRFSWQIVNQKGDYVEYLRSDLSRPGGAASAEYIGDGGANSFPVRQTQGNELFTDRTDNNTGRMADHSYQLLRHVKRVEVSAALEIEALAPCHRPGVSVSLEGGSTIPVFGVMRTVILRSQPKPDEEGQTTLFIEPPDDGRIYSQPTSGYTGGGNASGGDKGYSTSVGSYGGGYTGNTGGGAAAGTDDSDFDPEGTGQDVRSPKPKSPAGGASAPIAGESANSGAGVGRRPSQSKTTKPARDYTPREYKGKDYSQVGGYSGPDYSKPGVRKGPSPPTAFDPSAKETDKSEQAKRRAQDAAEAAEEDAAPAKKARPGI